VGSAEDHLPGGDIHHLMGCNPENSALGVEMIKTNVTSQSIEEIVGLLEAK
jgi:hypothetical protein